MSRKKNLLGIERQDKKMVLKTPVDLKKPAIDFINGQHIMTIASSECNVPWAAPVYYIFDDSDFYFFSKPSSRHITDLFKTNKAGVSIHFQSSGWSDIKGVQMSGLISNAGISKKSVSAFNLYLTKFDFIGEIKKSTVIKDIAAVESVFKVKFYKFTPEEILYSDNTIKFGFKEKIFI